MTRWLGVGLLFVGAGLALVRRKVRGGSALDDRGEASPSEASAPSIAAAAPGLSDVQRDRVSGFTNAWTQLGLPRALQLAFIANALEESGIRLAVRSGAGLADDAAGGSWTAFQALRPAVARAASALGLRYEDVVPASEPTGAALQRYAANQARVAAHIAERELGHHWDGADPEISAFDLFTRWAAGPSWSARRVLAAPGVLRVLGGRLPSDADLPGAVSTLRAQALDISAGALEKLAHFRRFRRALS